MIIFYILNSCILFLAKCIALLPSFTVLPFGMTAALITGTSYFFAFLGYWWPLQIVWTCFLWYLVFKVSLAFLRLLIGHRAPGNS